jgi:hypothetical protein
MTTGTRYWTISTTWMLTMNLAAPAESLGGDDRVLP